VRLRHFAENRVSPPRRQRHLAALLRTLRENGRLLALLTRCCEADRLTPSAGTQTFHLPADIAAYLGPEMADLPQEQLRVILLDRRGRLIDAPLVYQGGQSETTVRFADCFREAVRRSAAAVELVHNHPSGDPSASQEDVHLTRDAGQAGLLLGIEVLDHVILARDGFVSLRAEGQYAPPAASVASSPLAMAKLVRVDGWGYDCARCGASVRGLESSSCTCQRCLAPVTSRLIPIVSGPFIRELPRPTAA
jgi:DNA repair protein RadC